ncbi:MFS transporter [Xenorhabdus sp. XENO-7]|uniref:MFS transporter n=1 Tax=Xenorhabdus aichiensis TaxID=3025874 RepID=A0ABT5M3X3_9GAMM|nr:MFS transporter [Xenorhabdus aichiensis]
MRSTTSHTGETNALPLASLLALAMTGFLALMTETVPAGMLAQISMGLNISESMAGQFVTLYAIGSVIAAIPLTTATQSWRRRPLLLVVLGALFVFNTLTILTSNYTFALIARLFAGMAGGLIWGMLAGYARRMASEPLKGRALAIAGVGAPLALSLGVPLGAFLGSLIGWRMTFGLLSLLTLAVMVWIRLRVPDYPGQSSEKRLSIRSVFATPGVWPVLTVLIFWVLAHSILYTYIMPFLAPAGLSHRVDIILLIFGVASVLGIWLVGVLIDRYLRSLVLISIGLFALVALALGLAGILPAVIYISMAIWGLTFGGAAALLQTASADAAGSGADVAQSILVTVWNLSIAAGGMLGGILLDTQGVQIFPWVLLGLLVVGLIIAWGAKKHGFPATRQ